MALRGLEAALPEASALVRGAIADPAGTLGELVAPMVDAAAEELAEADRTIAAGIARAFGRGVAPRPEARRLELEDRQLSARRGARDVAGARRRRELVRMRGGSGAVSTKVIEMEKSSFALTRRDRDRVADVRGRVANELQGDRARVPSTRRRYWP